MRFNSWLITILFLGFSTHLLSQKPKPKLTGIFSTLSYGEESGDLGGMEIFIFYSEDYWVLFNEAEGAPASPALVKAKIVDSNIEFNLIGVGNIKKTFKGKITKTQLVGSFNNSPTIYYLPRKNSVWQ